MTDPLARETRPAFAPDPTLDALPAGAALLDDQLRLKSANARFLSRCPSAVPGDSLFDALPPVGEPPTRPAPGELTVYLARAATGVLEVRLLGGASGAGVSLGVGYAEQAKVQDALLGLSREVALAASEEEMVGAIARCVRQLFPGRYSCVRIVDPRTCALTSLYAEGKLAPGRRDRLAVRRAAAEKAGIELRTLPPDRVDLTTEEPLLFAGATAGFATPLAAAGQLFGMVNLEYPPDRKPDPRDERLLIQLANQAAVGVRNAKLIEELTFVRKYLEELLENANALILVVDRELRVIVFNRALVRLTGFERSEVVGRSVLELVPESERPKVRAVVEKCLSGQSVDAVELVLSAKSGAEVRVALSAATVRTAAGDVEGVIATGQDLSRQRELERRVIQAEKLASLGQLAAGVVHEINNPLTTITLYADALLQASAAHQDPGEVEKLKRIRESSERILKFARDLTSYARPSNDRPEPVEVHALLDQAARYCEHALKQSKARLSRTYAASVPKVLGVRANLVQVFVNLLTNACHAMPPGGGSVGIETRAGEAGVEIDVRDDGQGIEPRNLHKIFEPFFTTKPEGKGTGLGLTIVQGIVEKHGGSVKATSEPGRGTTFTVWLPYGE